ncbi:MAG: hypothetical protein QXY82_07210 [Desulfurococcaceae archaeon]
MILYYPNPPIAFTLFQRGAWFALYTTFLASLPSMPPVRGPGRCPVSVKGLGRPS